MKASHKVPGGKMVNIEIKEEDSTVSEINIRGDFFIEPPEKLEALENSIEGLNIEADSTKIERKLEDVDAELIGFSPSDIVKAFKKAVKGEEK